MDSIKFMLMSWITQVQVVLVASRNPQQQRNQEEII